MEPQDYNKEYARIYKEFDDLYHEVALGMGFSDSAFEILYGITVCGEGCTQKELCDLSCTKKQTVNSAIQKLAREGVLWLESGRARTVHVYLTEEGKQIVKEKIEPILQYECAVFEEMPSKEREELLRLSKKYLDSLKEKLRKGEEK